MTTLVGPMAGSLAGAVALAGAGDESAFARSIKAVRPIARPSTNVDEGRRTDAVDLVTD